jgi:hypothetical protein
LFLEGWGYSYTGCWLLAAKQHRVRKVDITMSFDMGKMFQYKDSEVVKPAVSYNNNGWSCDLHSKI